MPTGLGMNLGMTPQQQRAFQQASQGGNLNAFMQQHPEIAGRFKKRVEQQGAAARTARGYLGQDKNAAKGNTAPQNTAPQNTAPAGQGGQKQGKPPTPPPQNTSPAGQGGQKGNAPPTYQQGLNAQFGSGNPFGMQGNYTDPNNPLYAAATQLFNQANAGIGARYAAGGTPNSARQALEQGQAAGTYGAQLAQVGQQAREQDANRGLQAFLGAGGLQNQNNALALQANQNLAGLGTGLTGIGAQEQQIPNLGAIIPYLTAFQNIAGAGGNQSGSASGFAFK